MKTVTLTFHHKTLRADAESFKAIKADYDARDVAYTTDEKGNIKRDSDNVSFNIPTLEEFISHPSGEKVFEKIVQKLILSDADVRKSVVNGETLSDITVDTLVTMLASKKKGSGNVRFKAAEKKAISAAIIADYFAEIPESIRKVLQAVFEASASKAKLTAINNLEFVEKLMNKLLELAEQEEDSKTVAYLLQLVEAMSDFLESQAQQAQQLEAFEF